MWCAIRDYSQSLGARVIAVDAAVAAALDAVQIHGGSGCTREYSLERPLRDAKMMQIMEASSSDLKNTTGEELLAGLYSYLIYC